MNKFITSFTHTYLSHVKSKSFIITTLLLMALVFIGGNINNIINFFSGEDETITLEINASETHTATVSSMLEGNDIEIVESDGEYLLTIIEGTPIEATLESEAALNDSHKQSIEFALNEVNRQHTLNSLNLSEEEATLLNQEANISYETLDADEGSGVDEIIASGSLLNLVIFAALLFVMFFLIITYSSLVATGTALEKSSRVIEMIVSSVKPTTHLFAKILGILCVALTQLFFIAISILITYFVADVNEMVNELGVTPDEKTVPLIIYSVIFLILGIMLYLSVSALLGSFINRMEDLQQGIMPITMLVIAGFYLSYFSLLNTENALVTYLGWFPFFTPFVMPLKFFASDASHITMMFGIIVLVASIAIALFVAAYVYKSSVLSTESGIIKNLKEIRKNK